MDIGARIKFKRLENKMTLLEVANLLGVKEATVQRYESGKIKNLKPKTISQLAEIFHTTPAYLMGWEEESNVNNNISADSNLIGEKIKELRKKNNLSQTELSNSLNKQFGLKTDRVMISKWETGYQTPVMSTIACIAKYFNVTIDYLNGNNSQNNDSELLIGNLTKKQKKLLSITEKLSEEQIDDVIQYGLSLDIMNQVRAIKEEQKNIHYGQVVAYGGTNSPVVETKEQEEEIAKLLEEIRQEKNKKIEK